jgi:type IV pilus assembly protein PilW
MEEQRAGAEEVGECLSAFLLRAAWGLREALKVCVGVEDGRLARIALASSSSGRSELHCASRQGAGGQPLVDNVAGMAVWYGEANAASPRTLARYVRADAVTDWGLVLSVRVCLLMRSSEAVLGSDEDTLTYLDCDSEQQTVADGFVRRAFFSTTTLRNKMAF